MRNKHVCRDNRSWYVKNTELIAMLETQLQALQVQQAQLQHTQRNLQLQAPMVQGFCDTLMQLKKRMAEIQGRGAGPGMIKSATELQPACMPAPGAGATTAADLRWPPSALQLECSVHNIGSLSDPTAYVRQLLARDPVPGAKYMTAQQVAQVYNDTVLQSGMLLQQMPLMSNQQQQAAVKLQELWDRCLHTYLSPFIHGQQDYVAHVSVMNCSTLQQDEEGSAAALANLPSRLPDLGITPQQHEMISATFNMCTRHYKSIAAQRRQLQLQVAASHTCSMPGSSSSRSSRSNGSTGTNLLLTPECQHNRWLQLNKQQRAVQQLEGVLQKEVAVRLLHVLCVICCLRWEQLARLAVLCWPYVISPIHLAKVLQQQQQQEGQLQPQEEEQEQEVRLPQ